MTDILKTLFKIILTILGLIFGASILNEIEKNAEQKAEQNANTIDIEKRRYNEAKGYYQIGRAHV